MTTPSTASTATTPTVATPPAVSPPVVKRIPTTRTHHGDTVVDEYAWLANGEDPDTHAYLEAENAYAQARTAGQSALREEIFNEFKTRTKQTDLSLPTRKGGYWYYKRTVEGQQYDIHCRRAVVTGEKAPPSTEDGTPLDGEELLLDGNAEAGDSAHFALGTHKVSPDGNMLAYSVDLQGNERFTLRIKDLRTGQVLPDEIPNVFHGSAWSRDGSMVFYTVADEAWRPYQLWRHTVGTSADQDVLVFTEPDERFWIGIELTRSEAYIIVDLHSKVTSEVYLIPADAPTQPPRLVAPRRDGVDYSVEHDADHDRLLILHNDGALDFALAWTPAADPGPWHELIPHSPGTRLITVAAFAGHVVVAQRRDGLTALRVLPSASGDDVGEGYEISFPEPLYTVGLDKNFEYDTSTIRVRYTSMATPESIYDYDLRTREMVLRKQTPVLGGYDLSTLEQHREWAQASDGTMVPISIVCRRGTPRDGSAPAVIYGYGSYEASMDPWFTIYRLSLLDRGFVFAVAHVRGGGEMGRRWYEDGKLLAKKNTFTDFVACAQHLVKNGWTSVERLVARGGSAGGLLMGAVANLAPEAVAAIVAQVPFVDPLTTILDPSLPLTVIEWEEWGNPVESPEAYAYIKSYSPYENVAPMRYPAILVTTSLNDTRVLVREPAKWIARLRHVAPEGDYLLKTEMGSGHAGRSGRYDSWREEAFVLAWIINTVDTADNPPPSD